MANTYTWEIEPNGLVTISELDGKKDVVKSIYVILTATDGTNTVRLPSTTEVEYDANAAFTEFSALTEQTVINWVKGTDPAKTAAFEKSADKLLEKLANPEPVILIKEVPWKA